MNTDTETLRALDAWIGIHLFDMHEFQPAPSNKDVCAYCSHRVGFEMHFVPDWAAISDQLPRYSTDPAAAMMVLEKCASRHPLSIAEVREGVWWVHYDADLNEEADTLPLAICLFAKQLFSKPKL